MAVDERLQKAFLLLKKELINAQLQIKLVSGSSSRGSRRGSRRGSEWTQAGRKDKRFEKFKERAVMANMPEGVCERYSTTS